MCSALFGLWEVIPNELRLETTSLASVGGASDNRTEARLVSGDREGTFNQRRRANSDPGVGQVGFEVCCFNTLGL